MPRITRRAFARSAVLWGGGGFAATSLGLDVLMDCLPDVRDFGNQPPRGGDGATVLLLGSSRTGRLGAADFGLGGAGLRVANYGRTWATTAMQLVRLERALAASESAGILVEFVPAFFALPPGHPTPPGWLSAREAARYAAYSSAGWYREWVRSRALPHATFETQVRAETARRLGRWSPVTPTVDEVAAGPLTPERRARGLALAEQQYRGVLGDWHVEPAGTGAARDLLAVAAASGARVGVYTMPESPAFRTWYGPGVADAARRHVEGLAATVGAPAWWCTDWFPEDSFMDGHHLTTEGVARFEAEFAALVRPWAAGLR